MFTETLDQISKLRKQISSNLQQRGLIGEKTPDQLISEARDIMRRKIEFRDTTIDSRTFNQATGVLGSIGKFDTQIRQLTDQLAQTLKQQYPEIPASADSAESLVCGTLFLLDKDSSNIDRPLTAANIIKNINSQGAIDLLVFTCPEVEYSYLTGPDSSYFIRATSGKNTFDLQWQRNRQMFRQLSVASLPIRVNLIVGELDEESYIFPVLGKFGTNSYILNQLRATYRQSLSSKMSKNYPGVEFNVLGWSEVATDLQPQLPLASFNYLEEEKAQMRELMRPGKYYDGVLNPTDEQLTEICRLKMVTYATQGLVLKKLFPYAVGLQNESPAKLRSLMLNAGLTAMGLKNIPFIYPYNIKL